MLVFRLLDDCAGCCILRQPENVKLRFQAETFAKPKTQQEIVNSPSFPRRRESWLNSHNGLFFHTFMNIGQDSRLRGNDGISCFQAAFCVAGDGGMAWMGWF